MIPTKCPSGSATIAKRAPQNASYGGCELAWPIPVSFWWSRSTSSRVSTWKVSGVRVPRAAGSRKPRS